MYNSFQFEHLKIKCYKIVSHKCIRFEIVPAAAIKDSRDTRVLNIRSQRITAA